MVKDDKEALVMKNRENLSPHRRPSDLHQKSGITAKQGTEELKQEKWCEKLDRKTSVRGKTRLLRDVAGEKKLENVDISVLYYG